MRKLNTTVATLVALCAWIFFAAGASSRRSARCAEGRARGTARESRRRRRRRSRRRSTKSPSRITSPGSTERTSATPRPPATCRRRTHAGKPRAEIFYTAYVKDDAEKSASSSPAEAAELRRAGRPVTFAFNGGPGAASMWLNLGALGPKRVQTADDGKSLPDPIQLVDNEFTWLEFTDLVFVDPVGTGYSRPAAGVEAKTFYNVEADVESAANFIRLYVTRERALALAEIPGRRKLRRHARGRALDGTPERPRHEPARHRADLIGPRLPDHLLRSRQRPAVRALSARLHGHRLVPQEAAGGLAAAETAGGAGGGGTLGDGEVPARASQGRLADGRGARRDREGPRALHRPAHAAADEGQPAHERTVASPRNSSAIRTASSA